VRAVALVACLLLAAGGCRRAHHPHPEATIEEPSELRAAIEVANPADEGQLLDGFYPREPGGWRWSAPEFTITLAAPPELAGKDAQLEMEFLIPEAAATDLAGLTITAAIDGRDLAPWRAAGAGAQKAVFAVPGELLRESAVIVDFRLDRFVAPRGAETRRLGIIPSRFRLAARGK
jgi:hypothetical protein